MSVSHETPSNARMCPCGAEPCRPGQRNGQKCAAQASKDYRKRQAQKRAENASLALAGIAARARQMEQGSGI